MHLRKVRGFLKVLFGITLIVFLTWLVRNIKSLQSTMTIVPSLGQSIREPHQGKDGGHKDLQSKTLSPEIRNQIKALLLFVGYPRSGHTLIGSLLDAHPHIVIANEYNMVGRWKNWTANEQNARNLFDKLYRNSYQQTIHGFRWENKLQGRTYAVPHQWQGKYKNFISVIGDKKGGKTTKLLTSSKKILTQISKTLGLPIKIIHVVRNPFDNIATMILRKLNIKTSRDELMKNPINDPKRLLNFAKYYITLASANLRLIRRFRDNMITLHSENIIKNPKQALEKLCRFLEVPCPEDYLQDCAGIVYKNTSKSRLTMVWPKEIKRYVLKRTRKIPFLKGYSFDV